MSEYWILYAVGALLLFIGGLTAWKTIAISTGHAVLLALGAGLVALPHLKDFEFGDGKLKFTTREEAKKIADAMQTLSEQQVALSTQLKDTTARVTESITAINTQQTALENAVKTSQPTLSIPKFQKLDPAFWKDLNVRNEQIEKRVEQERLQFEKLQQDFTAPM